MKKNFLAVFGLLLVLTVMGSAAIPDRQMYFPYVVNDEQTQTELIFTNATGFDANVTLFAYKTTGELASLSTAPVQVAANSQITINAGTLGISTGWVIAESDVPGLIGNLRVGSPDWTSADIAAPAHPSKQVVFPFIASGSQMSTDIAVANPNVYSTRAVFNLYDKGGSLLYAAKAVIPAYGVWRGSLTALFGSDKDFSGASHMIVQSQPLNIFASEVSIVGFEVVRGFYAISGSRYDILARKDLAALTAIPTTGFGNSIVFPHVLIPKAQTDPMNWFSLLGVVNLSGASQDVAFSYYDDSGILIASKTRNIPVNGALRITAGELFEISDANLHSGWVQASAGGSLAAFQGIGTMAGSNFGVAPGQSSALAEFLFPALNTSGKSYTGLVLLNAGDTPVNVDVFLMSPEGANKGSITKILQGKYRLVDLVENLILEGINQPSGYIYVRTSAPIYALGLLGVSDTTLSQLSPEPIAGFNPPLQTSFVIRGNITQWTSGVPIQGVTVQLFKGADIVATATTDKNGYYLFQNLESGIYTVTPIMADTMFSPASRIETISAGTASIQNADFRAAPALTLTQITVVTTDQSDQKSAGNNPDPYALFGTSEVSLKIEGTSFILPSLSLNLYLRNTADQSVIQIPSGNLNIVDSKTLFVRLPLSSAGSQILPAGHYELYLTAQPPNESLQSNVLPFYILPTLPVLTSVLSSSGTASTYARYEINSPGELIRVYGYGFRPGARVLFNGTTALNGTEIDTKYYSSTYLTAFLPAQALRFGGIYILRVRNVSELPESSGEAVNFQINNLKPEIVSLDPPSPINIIGPGPGPVTIDLTINGNNFHPAGDRDPGTIVAVTNIEPDIFPAIVPVGGPTQCIRTNGRTILRVRVYNADGTPAAGVSVTFTAPVLVTTEATGSFPGGASTITLVTDQNGFAPGLNVANPPLFTANPFAGSYAVKVEATVSGYPLLAVFNITNLNFGDTCSAGTGEVNFVSSHQIIVANLPIPNAGKYSVVVANAAPGGGYSNEMDFVVSSGPASSVPQLVSLSPASVAAGSGDFVLTAVGSGFSFKTSSWINFGTVLLKTTFVDGNTLRATVPALLISSPGIVPVTVTNPGGSSDTGGTSSRQLFYVQ